MLRTDLSYRRRALLAEGLVGALARSAFALEFQRAECEFLTGALAAAEKRLRRFRPAPKLVERPPSRACGSICTRPLIRATAPLRSVWITSGVSDRLVTASDEQRGRGPNYERMWSRARDSPDRVSLDLPSIDDPDRRATLDVLTSLAAPALFTDAESAPPGRLPDGEPQPRAWQQRRILPRLCLAGPVRGPVSATIRPAFRFGRLGLDLVENVDWTASGPACTGLRACRSSLDQQLRTGRRAGCGALSTPASKPAI